MTDRARYALFVRAINTGRRRVHNDDLIRAVSALGVDDVAAYQAAGNLTFRATPDTVPDERSIGDHLGHRLGFECPTFLRVWPDLRSISERCPFTAAERAATENRVQVTFLASAASPTAARSASDLVPPDDRVVVDGREWWWLPREGISGSTLDVGAVERELGPMTMRTLATVARFVARFPD